MHFLLIEACIKMIQNWQVIRFWFLSSPFLRCIRYLCWLNFSNLKVSNGVDRNKQIDIWFHNDSMCWFPYNTRLCQVAVISMLSWNIMKNLFYFLIKQMSGYFQSYLDCSHLSYFRFSHATNNLLYEIHRCILLSFCILFSPQQHFVAM